MKKIFLTLLTVIFCASAFSQTVESIRKDYAEAMNHAKMMNDPEYPPTNRFQVVTEQMMAGSGPHKVSATFYYFEDEEDMNPGNVQKSIWYVTYSYNWAARDYYEEYLYNEKGKIEFIYQRGYDDDFQVYEYRFYFDAKGGIKVIVKRKKEEDKTFTQEYSGATVTAKYKEAYDSAVNMSEYFKTMFKTLDTFSN